MIGLMLLAAAGGFPVFIDGNSLYERCQAANRIVYMAYVTGVNDALDDLASVNIIPKQFCLGPGVTPLQEADVVTAYLRDHPAARNQGGGGLVAVALAEAFPCTKQ